MIFYKYHGAGNDFLIADGRDKKVDLSPERIAALCERHTGIGADGVMVLERSDTADFRMRYYNSDGSGGMMCGNGGRCIVAFAAALGYSHFEFEAPDGRHIAEIERPLYVQKPEEEPGRGLCFSTEPMTVRLKMRDVCGAVKYGDDWFLDTGTRHLVRFVPDLSSCDVTGQGRSLRYDSRFAPEGVNVNFVQVFGNEDEYEIKVRTYEKGVENETLACGTGIVASSLATWLVRNESRLSEGKASGEKVSVKVHARISDLVVEFIPSRTLPFNAEEVWLTGPAAYVGKVEIE